LAAGVRGAALEAEMRKRSRLAAVLALLLVLAALPAAAAGPGRELPAWQGLAGVWAWIAARLPLVSLRAAACDQSSYIDPDGRCRAGLVSTAVPDLPKADQSLYIDPNGSTAAPDLPRADQSSYIDPNG
jgi:hypothetical protein